MGETVKMRADARRAAAAATTMRRMMRMVMVSVLCFCLAKVFPGKTY